MYPATIIATLCALAFLFTLLNYILLRFQMEDRIRDRIEAWQDREFDRIQRDAAVLAKKEATLQFESWRRESETDIRQDAIKKSKAVTGGKVTEHFVPFFHEFPFNPSDARFLGSPVDFVVFDGLADNEEIDVVFIEVKTGNSSLTKRERRVRDAIRDGRVTWVEARRKPPAVLELSES